MRQRLIAALALSGFASSLVWSADTAKAKAIRDDVQLRAMTDELARAKTLQLNNLDKPYFVQYSSGDAEECLISASLGGLIGSVRVHGRSPSVVIRVGSYEFDNTNSIYTTSARFGSLPIDDDYNALRNDFWLASDAMYKAATDQITRKRNALREVAEEDKTPDLSAAKPVIDLEPEPRLNLDQKKWEDIMRRVSERFEAAPSVSESSVRFRTISSSYRVVNSEGTVIRIPQELTDVTIHGEGLAPDGNKVWDYRSATGLRVADLPRSDELEQDGRGSGGRSRRPGESARG